MSTACFHTRSAILEYIIRGTQVVSSRISVDCTIIGGHSYYIDAQRAYNVGYGDGQDPHERRAAIYGPGWLPLLNQRLAGDWIDPNS